MLMGLRDGPELYCTKSKPANSSAVVFSDPILLRLALCPWRIRIFDLNPIRRRTATDRRLAKQI